MRILRLGLALLFTCGVIMLVMQNDVPAMPEAAQRRAPDPADPGQTERAPFYFDTDKATAIWNDWLDRHGVEAAAMALGQHGRILLGQGRRRSPDAAYPVASLSKAVTAICLDQVLAQGPYDWGSTLGDLAPVLNAVNMSPHAGIRDLRLSDIATHRSGFPKNIDASETAGEGRNLYTQMHFARAALGTPSHATGDRQHHYSNVNYALLGQLITALTGAPYSDHCSETIMAPAGAKTAAVGGWMWATAGFGGWSISAKDYARFVMHWMSPDRPWIARPQDRAYDRSSGAGLGAYHNWRHGGHVVGHNGLWRHSTDAARRHGAMFLTGADGATFVGNWQGSLPDEAYRDLWQSMSTVLR
jgi:CubicO group peptidase (beta-lactamase class C family)